MGSNIVEYCAHSRNVSWISPSAERIRRVDLESSCGHDRVRTCRFQDEVFGLVVAFVKAIRRLENVRKRTRRCAACTFGKPDPSGMEGEDQRMVSA